MTSLESNKNTDMIKNCALEGLLHFKSLWCFSRDFIFNAVIFVIFPVNVQYCLFMLLVNNHTTNNNRTVQHPVIHFRASLTISILCKFGFSLNVYYQNLSYMILYQSNVDYIHLIGDLTKINSVSVLQWNDFTSFILIYLSAIAAILIVSCDASKQTETLNFVDPLVGTSININRMDSHADEPLVLATIKVIIQLLRQNAFLILPAVVYSWSNANKRWVLLWFNYLVN